MLRIRNCPLCWARVFRALSASWPSEKIIECNGSFLPPWTWVNKKGVAASIATSSPAKVLIWWGTEIVLDMGGHWQTDPCQYTPIPTKSFLLDPSVNPVRRELEWLEADFIATSFSGIVIVTDSTHGGFAKASIISRLVKSSEANLVAIFCNGDIQVLLGKIIDRLPFQKRGVSGLVCHLIHVVSSC